LRIAMVLTSPAILASLMLSPPRSIVTLALLVCAAVQAVLFVISNHWYEEQHRGRAEKVCPRCVYPFVDCDDGSRLCPECGRRFGKWQAWEAWSDRFIWW
jgi:hypothetical protein